MNNITTVYHNNCSIIINTVTWKLEGTSKLRIYFIRTSPMHCVAVHVNTSRNRDEASMWALSGRVVGAMISCRVNYR